MRPTPWLWLYRPSAPGPRAQSVQVIHMAHAMARRGHPVTLAVDPLHAGDPASVLRWYGLQPVPALRLVILPRRRTPAGVAWRVLVAAWLARHGRRGVVYARSKRYAREVLRVAPRARLVLEAHEVDSLQAEERGEDPRPWRALEARVLGRARGVVANAPGTLHLLRRAHPALPPAVALHNATHADRVRTPEGPGRGVGYAGSARPTKGVDDLARAARLLSVPVTLVGAEDGERLVALSCGRLAVESPVPHALLPDRLARFRVLVLTLSTGLFGEHLTSPLKLQDYLASGVPVVAADTPAVREAAGDAVLTYPPGDPVALADAITRLYHDEALRSALLERVRVRTWDERAAEVEAFVEGLP